MVVKTITDFFPQIVTFAVLSLWFHQVLDFVTDFLVFTLFKLYVSGNLLKTWKTLVSNISVDNGKYILTYVLMVNLFSNLQL